MSEPVAEGPEASMVSINILQLLLSSILTFTYSFFSLQMKIVWLMILFVWPLQLR